MFTYLEKILGKPLKYYESLMASKSEKAVITKDQINKVLLELRPLSLPAMAFDSEIKDVANSLLNPLVRTPKNTKGDQLSFKGGFLFGDQILLVFINENKALTDKSNYSLIIQEPDELITKNKDLILNSAGVNFKSIPIWEEVIHRFPDIHKLIVFLNAKNPWTLYKEVKRNFELPQKQIFIGGYPQWRINDVDFRKLKNLKFLLEYQVTSRDFSIYFFQDGKTNEIVTMLQRG
jgi:hypothetical protein